ncbi:GUN4 domain-containing protein [Tolypothrix sp. FACHB-123]|uniref:TIR domain-containing protein n=1 Tax=Tolypothrix sp. FACHB-123 TaxID=2692868 RepID=UPI001685B778|nr:TIR domain-containing protein [Tolypothrix sp. FACHB-123]MBD2358880.1 GUN4 domain-containing protein [Tolypothrix sp. FACHB-123]
MTYIQPQFGVFLCHNSEDKPQLRIIAECLKNKGIHPWFDEWELRPGVRWQQVLQEQISQIEAAAVFVGSNGLGPWQQQELEAFLVIFAENNKPLIPVLLPDAPQKPELPLFLRGRMWVDFRQSHPEPIGQLIWGITGNRPTYEEGLSLEAVSGLILPNQPDTEDTSELEKLEILLSAQKWQEADEQTRKIVLKNNQNNPLTASKIRQLSLNLLDSIDQLWVAYSDENFGLRIQSQLWQKILEPEKPRFKLFAKKVEPITDSQAWTRFGCLVGWRGDDEKLLPDVKLDFSIKAPSGCFPRTRLWLHGGHGNTVKQFVALMERVAQLE